MISAAFAFAAALAAESAAPSSDPASVPVLQPGEAYALIECDLNADGTLANCLTLYEAPAGSGFAEGCLKATAEIRMRPPPPELGEVKRVRIPFRFKPGTTATE
ncbi:energy transducer TonB [Caulobacter sp. 17J80-11]|uniref:energy transducer TonB family protein n=1 Tax=Caulobacter sp. 17J80-11 TaxID=2763502 RepID=UPI0016537310|nr:energy transducer TonB [Caulobacter sp. 17J80-11]MBC6982010.1 energy transducer TonB [Caulobacter sp. 17J80-11]